MPFEPDHHRRHPIRLRGYDYTTPGAYFVTICTHGRECLLGHVSDAEMHVNAMGRVVQEEWGRTAAGRENVALDAFIVMPNHVHGIICLTDGRGMARHAPTPPAQFGRPIANSLATIMGALKSAAARRINALRGTPGLPVWQRNYYEHVVGGEAELNGIRDYIAFNPAGWADDPENLAS